MTLPNLTELHINPVTMSLTTEMRNLEKLVIVSRQGKVLDAENVANAISLMPNLTSLMLDDEHVLTAPALRTIKQIVHSRGQKIVLYEWDSTTKMKEIDIIQVGEVVSDVPSNKKFSLLIHPIDFLNLPILLSMINHV